MLIEDAAHCVEGRSAGAKIGATADLTCFSFYATKNLTTGEGGMLTTRARGLGRVRARGVAARHEPRRAGRARAGRLAALRRRDARLQVQHDGPAGRDRPAPARELEARLQRREAIWRHVRRGARRPAGDAAGAGREPATCTRGISTPCSSTRDSGWTRDALAAALRDEGIATSVHFRALHLQPYYAERFRLRRGMFPVAEMVSERTLSLPLSAAMTDDQVERVVDACSGTLLRGTVRMPDARTASACCSARPPGRASASATSCAAVRWRARSACAPLVAVRGTAATRRRAAAGGWRVVDVQDDDDLRRLDPRVLVVDDPSAAAVRAWVRRARRAGVPVATVHDLGIAAT